MTTPPPENTKDGIMAAAAVVLPIVEG
ncbi:unnamed protein product, partial [Rotaria socialis]